MKALFVTALCMICFSFRMEAQASYKLNDAIAKGFVKIKISGNGSHTGKCALLQAENTTVQNLDITVDCGQKIQCSDSTEQNLIITQTEKIHLSPKKILTTAFYAMCINASKSCPGNKRSFNLGKMAQGALLKLTQFIEKKKYQNSNAQSAVWTITDNKAIASIGNDRDDDYQIINELRGFVATEKHVTNYPKAMPRNRAEKNVEGTFDLILQTKTLVEVVMVDSKNKAVKQLMKETKEAGILRINYSVKNTDFKAGDYFIVVRSGNKEIRRETIRID